MKRDIETAVLGVLTLGFLGGAIWTLLREGHYIIGGLGVGLVAVAAYQGITADK